MKKHYLLLFLLLCYCCKIHAQWCLPCGTGTNGAFDPVADTTLPGGIYEYSSFNIRTGVTVTVTGTTALIIKCTGKVTITGILTASGGNGGNGVTNSQAGLGGVGVAGGANGGDGIYSSVTGPLSGSSGLGQGGVADSGSAWSGGGGAGYGTTGDTAGPTGGPHVGFGGPAYSDSTVVNTYAGSGGGGGSGGYSCGGGGGGAGGGLIQIGTCDTVIINASGIIRSNGGNGGSDGTGSCGGGGGGSGGTIWISARQITNNGLIQAIGGTGGASNVPGSPYYGTGGNGAVGRIRLDRGLLTGTGTVTPASTFSDSLLAVVTVHGPVCHNDIVDSIVAVVNGVGPIDYLWSDGTTVPIIHNASPGPYTLQYNDGHGCYLSISTTVVNPPLLTSAMSHTDKTTAANNGTATATPAGGVPGYNYSWSPGGGTTQTITGLGAGLYTVTITDANGCVKTDTVTVHDVFTSVATQNISSAISIYPNPANDLLNIQMNLTQPDNVSIMLMDYTGRILETNNYKTNSGKTTYTLAMNQYANGNYFIKIRIGTQVQNIPINILR